MKKLSMFQKKTQRDNIATALKALAWRIEHEQFAYGVELENLEYIKTAIEDEMSGG